MAKILLVNGPNLNLLGEREPHIYGSATLKDVEAGLRKIVEPAGHTLLAFQSNHEGAIVDWLHANRGAGFLLINAASLTHTSVAVRDAVKMLGVPCVEIHISNVYKREPFRHLSYLSDIAEGVIVGLGTMGYELAARYAVAQLAKPK
jgi:3-dehydroquinate dehydratase-2